MIDLAAARAEIGTVLAQIRTDWTAYPLVIEVDNDVAVDQATQPNPYLKVSIKNVAGDQLDLGDDPNTQQRGQILVSACTRAGGGTADGLALLSFVSRYFANKDFATVRCHTFEAVGGKDVKGWWYENGIINYWFVWRKSQ